jgi:anthranilate synthase component 1
MKRIKVFTSCTKMLADVHTPVGIYLRLRDKFRDTILLESADSHAADNSFSFIGINAIAGIEISDENSAEIKLPGQPPEQLKIDNDGNVPAIISNFMQQFETVSPEHSAGLMAQGLFGYTSYDAIGLFETISSNEIKQQKNIPLIRYRFYQYVIAIDHFRDVMYLCENRIDGLESHVNIIASLIRNRDVPAFPFNITGDESSSIDDGAYISMVQEGIRHCLRGDVFQVVLSRAFQQKFTGDEFNVYRALRTVNPSPYMFYFDYGDYRLLGSSPEAQLLVKDDTAKIHPIAGTIKRTGDAQQDKQLAEQLLADPKENAEHVMLVDLARNDLNKSCGNAEVVFYRQAQYYSHVIHLVSEVKAKVAAGSKPYDLLSVTFPAGTLSGAPKYRAMQLIDEIEPTARGFYGGCIGYIGFDGSCNHAIMIRSLMSKRNTLHYQAGAGIVAASVPENELQEVNNKLAALKQAIVSAQNL